MTRFEADTAVVADPAAPGRWRARADRGWWAFIGPNGGYLAAIVTRALGAELARRGRGDRPLRSLTLHYLRAPEEGELTVDVVVERDGRSVTALSARLAQGGRPCVLALAAASVDFPPTLAFAGEMPVVPPPEEVAPEASPDQVSPMSEHLVLRPCVGGRIFSRGERALTGGWMAYADPGQPYDAPALAMLADAWLPAAWVLLDGVAPAPTVDLTIHFRAPEARVAGPVLGAFRSTLVHGGFLEEDGELWSRDGALLLQSRQLAALREQVR